MPTTFSEIISGYFFTYIEDPRITYEMANNPARAMRRLSRYMPGAVSMFTRPPSMAQMLAYTDAQYNDFVYTSPLAQTAPVTVSTGQLGFELCSAVQMGTSTPVSVSYDAETGDVTINEDLAEGQQVDMDFYTDGTFVYELDHEQKNILGHCLANKWFTQLSNNYLDLTPKVRDKTFDTASESAHMTAGTARLKENKNTLSDDLLAYEQRVAYRKTIPPTQWLRPPNPLASGNNTTP